MSNFTTFLKEFNMTFENRPINNELIPIPIDDAQFGILCLQAEACQINKIEITKTEKVNLLVHTSLLN